MSSQREMPAPTQMQTPPAPPPQQAPAPAQTNGGGPLVTSSGLELGSTKFIRPSGEVKTRTVATIRGFERGGKTHLALTSTPPVFVLAFDNNTVEVSSKFARQGIEVYLSRYRLPFDHEMKGRTTTVEVLTDDEREKYREIYRQFTIDWTAATTAGKGTIVVDSFTELMQVLRLITFGKLTQVLPQHHDTLNAHISGLVSEAYDCGMSVLFVLRMRPLYEGNSRTGEYEPSQPTDFGYKVQTEISSYRDSKGKFHTLVLNCSQNHTLAGLDWEGGQWTSMQEVLGFVFR